TYALLFVALYASTPVAFIENATLFVENPLTAFLLASFVLLARRWECPEVPDLFALVILLGAGCSSKLHGVIFLACLGPILCRLCLRQRRWTRNGLLLPLAILIGTFLAAPPYAAAWWKTGNPVFPFYNAYFKSPLYPSDANFTDPRWGALRWRSFY